MSAPTIAFALLRDGGQALIRPYDAADRAAVTALFNRMSLESRAMRFHTGGLRIDSAVIDRATSGFALVAERGGSLVGLASYIPLRDPTIAEMAITVDDAEHGRGIGTALFEQLTADARRQGIRHLLAEVMSSNSNMFDLLQNLGFHTTRTYDHGEIEVAIDLQPGPEYIAHADARRHVAAVASLEPLLRARSVAVVGASRRPGSIGNAIFHNLLSSGFTGVVYPVNPSAASVDAVKAYATRIGHS